MIRHNGRKRNDDHTPRLRRSVGVRLEHSDYNMLEYIADGRGISISECIREAIVQYINENYRYYYD